MTDVSPTAPRHLPLTPTRRAVIAAALGVVVTTTAAFLAPWQAAPLLGWASAALVWSIWTWWAVLRLNAQDAGLFATREEPHRPTTDLFLVSAAVASLIAVVLGVIKAANVNGDAKYLLLVGGVGSIVGSWGVVQTVFALRYAALYYRDGSTGIDFNDKEEPTYADFAYRAFTIGMTYQVSDTDLTVRSVRHTALRHALLSYLFGTVIIATTINIAAGLTK